MLIFLTSAIAAFTIVFGLNRFFDLVDSMLTPQGPVLPQTGLHFRWYIDGDSVVCEKTGQRIFIVDAACVNDAMINKDVPKPNEPWSDEHPNIVCESINCQKITKNGRYVVTARYRLQA